MSTILSGGKGKKWSNACRNCCIHNFIYLQSNSDNMNDDPREEFVVRARGLPWSATAESVAEFFSGRSDKIF